MNAESRLRRLRDALIDFALTHPHPAVANFHAALEQRPRDYVDVAPRHLPAADHLAAALLAAEPRAGEMLALFAQHSDLLCWEQSYRGEDGAVDEAMLADYAFTEIIGKRGPFVSDRFRAGIGIYGPHIDYPRHRHHAEEIYSLLAGSADFLLDGEYGNWRAAGDLVHMPSNAWHGFRTGADALVIYYLWQGGDLREISTFG